MTKNIKNYIKDTLSHNKKVAYLFTKSKNCYVCATAVRINNVYALDIIENGYCDEELIYENMENLLSALAKGKHQWEIDELRVPRKIKKKYGIQRKGKLSETKVKKAC